MKWRGLRAARLVGTCPPQQPRGKGNDRVRDEGSRRYEVAAFGRPDTWLDEGPESMVLISYCKRRAIVALVETIKCISKAIYIRYKIYMGRRITESIL
jgi:hypothetical protein